MRYLCLRVGWTHILPHFTAFLVIKGSEMQDFSCFSRFKRYHFSTPFDTFYNIIHNLSSGKTLPFIPQSGSFVSERATLGTQKYLSPQPIQPFHIL